jgi:site-specific DNA-methyltransferase (adenine-specific)
MAARRAVAFAKALAFMAIGWNLHDTMIFQKVNPIPQIYRKRYQNVFEYMFVFSKGRVATHHPILVDSLHAGLELNGTSYKNYSKHEQKREKRANPVKATKLKGNIWQYVVGKRRRGSRSKRTPRPLSLPTGQRSYSFME